MPVLEPFIEVPLTIENLPSGLTAVATRKDNWSGARKTNPRLTA